MRQFRSRSRKPVPRRLAPLDKLPSSRVPKKLGRHPERDPRRQTVEDMAGCHDEVEPTIRSASRASMDSIRSELLQLVEPEPQAHLSIVGHKAKSIEGPIADPDATFVPSIVPSAAEPVAALYRVRSAGPADRRRRPTDRPQGASGIYRAARRCLLAVLRRPRQRGRGPGRPRGQGAARMTHHDLFGRSEWDGASMAE